MSTEGAELADEAIRLDLGDYKYTQKNVALVETHMLS